MTTRKLHPLENQTTIKIPKKYLDRVWAIDIVHNDETTYMLVFQDGWCCDGNDRSRVCYTQKEVLDDIKNSEPYIYDD